jgi:hypothetical protein
MKLVITHKKINTHVMLRVWKRGSQKSDEHVTVFA